MVQAVGLPVPVVTLPTESLDPAVTAGLPVPHEDTVGVLGVEEAMRCPYWSTSKSLTGAVSEGDVVAATVKIEPVVEAVFTRSTSVLKASRIENATAEVCLSTQSVRENVVVALLEVFGMIERIGFVEVANVLGEDVER